MNDKERAAWLAARRAGITATDAAAILGVHPYKGAFDVFADKLGVKPETPDNPAMYWGRALEAVVAHRYAADTGYKLVELAPGDVMKHPVHRWLVGTPDRLVPTVPCVLEVKTAGYRAADRWGDAPDGAIPEEYMVQCAVYMAITGYQTCDVAVLIGGQDYRVYNLARDAELEAMIIDECDRFRTNYIVPGREPPPDASDGCRKWLDLRYPKATSPLLMASPEADTLMMQLRELRATVAEKEARVAAVEASLKTIIAEHDGIEGPAGRITWRRAKDTTADITNWQAIANELAFRLDLTSDERGALVAANTATVVTKEGTRRFVVPRNWSKGGKE